MMLRQIRYCFLFLFLWPIISYAQSPAGISVHFPDEMAIAGQLVSLDVGLTNASANEFEGYWEVVPPAGLLLINQDRNSVQAQAGKKRFTSFRFQVKQLSPLKNKSVQISLRNTDGKVISSHSIPLVVPNRRDVKLQNLSDMQFFKQVGDSIRIRIQVNNNGTTDEQVRLVFTAPNRIGNREFKIIPLDLSAGNDTLIAYSFVVEKFMMNIPQYAVNIAGVYPDDDVFGNVPLSFSNLTSTRNYAAMQTEVNLPVYTHNYIEGMMTNGLSHTPNYYLRSQGSYWLSGGKVGYQLNVNQFGNFSNRPNVNNTFLQYEKNNLDLIIGNIQENAEASIFGRGARISLKNERYGNRHTLGIVEKSADLFGFYNGSQRPGFTAYFQTQLAKDMMDHKSYDGLAYYDYSSFDSTTSILFANNFDFLKPKAGRNMQLRGFVGSGVTQYSGAHTNNSLPSVAFGLKLNGRRGSWLYDSDNFYSSPYYTGNRRGTLHFNQRVSRQIRRSTVGIGYQYFHYAPKFANPRFMAMNNANMRAELSIQTPLSSQLSITLQPNYTWESGKFMSGNAFADVTKRAWQLGSVANFRSRDLRHHLFINTEVGWVDLYGATVNSLALRSNLSYNIGQLNVYGSYQTGTFQIYELYNSLFFQIPFGDRYTLGTSYQGNLFAQKLNWSTNLLTNMSRDYGNSYGTNLNLNYRVFRSTLLTTLFQYTMAESFTGHRYAYNNLQVGIRQNLKSPNMDRPDMKQGDLHIFCYYDHNNNMRYDEGDEPATDYTLLINNILFNTNKKGNATFKKLPYGQHQVFFPLKDNYQAVSQNITVASHKVQVQIPLQQVGSLHGQLELIYIPNRSMETDRSLENYTVIARDQHGKVFRTQTNAAGMYSIRLPEGEYEVYLDEALFPQHIFIPQNVRKATVEIGKAETVPIFQLEIKAKQAEVIRFGS